MQTVNKNQKSKNNDPVWVFLAEFTLCEFMFDAEPGDELTAGRLMPTIRDLGISPERLQKIEKTLIGFAKEAMAQFNQGCLEDPVTVRLFCQKKTIEEVNTAKSSNYSHAEQTMEPSQIIHHSEPVMNGGWGYFLIQRGRDFPAGPSARTHYLVDLYLYKEGE